MLTLTAIAEAFDVDERTVREWIRGGLPTFRRGRIVRVAEEDLERFRRANTWAAGAGAREPSAGASSAAVIAFTSTTGQRGAKAQMHQDGASGASSRRGQRRPPVHGSGANRASNVVQFGETA